MSSGARAQLIETAAGNGAAGYGGDGGPAANSAVNNPFGVAVDRAGNLYIADTNNNRIRVVNTGSSAITIAAVTIQPGAIATIAGNGSAGFSGDGGPATSAKLNSPFGVAVDNTGNIYIADLYNFRVRKVIANGTISTVTGTGTLSYSGDNGPAMNASLDPYAIALDTRGNLYISDAANQRIRVVNTGTSAITLANVTIQPGYIATLAGTGIAGSSWNGPANNVEFNFPYSVAVDGQGNVYICDTYNRSIRVLNTGPAAVTIASVNILPGYVTTVAGNGVYGYQGDGGPATNAEFADPDGVAVDSQGNIYISDLEGDRIRTVNHATGLILTIAGVAGNNGYNGDGIPATTALISYPRGLAVDYSGNVYFADQPNERIREIVLGTTNPAIISSSGTSFVEGTPSNFAVVTTYWPTPALSVTGTLPAGIVFKDQGNGTAILGGTPAAGTQGIYNLIFRATNGIAVDVTQNFILTVLAPGAVTLTSSALFIAADGLTQGNWQGTYGTDGYSLANFGQMLPGYASFNLKNQLNYTWESPSSNPTALQIPGSSGRIAATWYSSTSFTMDLNVGPNTHQIALYSLDWGSRGRLETIQIQDAQTGFPLDTEVASNFAGGTYLIWRVSGHVQLLITNIGETNAVVSAVFFGVGPGFVPTITAQPQPVIVAAGQPASFQVQAKGGPPLAYQWQSQPPGGSGFTNIAGANSDTYAISVTEVAMSGTQLRCMVTNNAGSATSAAVTLTVLPQGSPLPFVISETLGTSRNDYSGWVGMAIRVGPSPLLVNGLGRMVASGNSGVHTVKLVDAVSGSDLPGGSITVSTAGATPGTFAYNYFVSPVTLNGNGVYYVLTDETAAGDQWYDRNTTVQTQGVASVLYAVYGSGAPYTGVGTPGQTYGAVDLLFGGSNNPPPVITQQPTSLTVTVGQPATLTISAAGSAVNYQWQSQPPGSSGFTNISSATSDTYTISNAQLSQSGTVFRCIVANASGMVVSVAAILTVTPAPSGTPLVTSLSLGTARNDYSGWVGMTLRIGASPLPVNALGRIVAPGNKASHLVKIVDAASGLDIPGASVSVLSGTTAVGSFAYATLPAPVTLNANGLYYVLSQETAGGD
ncbi:MAG: immunoglobulin domain-containing protein, partial [Acidobacteriia bacterium]|nr:immunoglobulin domain-containing protein [Terriglobia bacterium]